MAESITRSTDLEDQVEHLLREANWEYKREVVVGAARPDFLVSTAGGEQIVVEVKDWDASRSDVGRAINQAQRYKQLTKVAAAIIVTRFGDTVKISEGGVAPIADFLSLLAEIAAALVTKRSVAKLQRASVAPNKKIFASMPFASEYDDTFLVAIAPAALAHNAIAERVDYTGTVGSVVPLIQSMIRIAEVVIADLSESRPNVLHEVGFAEALNKPIIQICRTPVDQMPFNVRNNQTIKYSIGQTAKLRKQIEEQLKFLIKTEI